MKGLTSSPAIDSSPSEAVLVVPLEARGARAVAHPLVAVTSHQLVERFLAVVESSLARIHLLAGDHEPGDQALHEFNVGQVT